LGIVVADDNDGVITRKAACDVSKHSRLVRKEVLIDGHASYHWPSGCEHILSVRNS
jgi:hypothetical protein